MKLVCIVSGGLSCTSICCNSAPNLILHDEHPQLFELLAQLLNVITNDAVIQIDVRAVVEDVQTALDVDFQSRSNVVGFFLILLEQSGV